MKLKKTSWIEIKEAYQRGGVSIRELAERFGISKYALEARCKRGKWHKEKSEIVRKVSEKIVEEVTDKVNQHIKATISLCDDLYADITRSREQLLPVINPVALDALSRSLVRVNEVARLSLGIPDKPTAIDVTSKNRSLGDSFVSAIQKLRENPATPKLTSRDIDLVIGAGIIDD